MRWLDAERPNLIAAARAAAGHGQASFAWRLADALHGYFWMRGDVVEWLAVADAGLAAIIDNDDATGPTDAMARARSRVELSLAEAHWRRGGYPRAIEHANRALDLARRAGWLEGEGATRSCLGVIHRLTGQLDEAAGHLVDASELYRRSTWGRGAGEATNLNSLGGVYWQLGRLREAADRYAEALTLCREIGSPVGEALAVGGLGEVRHMMGQPSRALDDLHRSLRLLRAVGHRSAEAVAANCLAAVHIDLGELDRARDLSETAMEIVRDTGDRPREADALNSLAAVRSASGQHREAAALYRLAVPLARETHDRYAEATALTGLALALVADRPGAPAAVAHATRALTISRQDGLRLLEGKALTALAAVHIGRGEPEVAERHATAAFEVHRATGHRPGLARTHAVLGAGGSAHHRELARRLFAEMGIIR